MTSEPPSACGNAASGEADRSCGACGSLARGRGTLSSGSRLGANACVCGSLENACDASVMETAREFTVRLQDLLRRERFALADFLVALADFDQHRVWVELG